MEAFDIERIVGEGSYGKAILARNKKNDKKVIIKQINVKKLSSKEVIYAKQEVQILERLKHPNIVRFIDSFNTKGNEALCIVMEYADGGDLDQFIKSNNNRLIKEDKVLDIFTQLCLAIKHIHDRKILHRDLKSKNVFLTKQGIVKVGDFGVSKVLRLTGEFAATCIGTPIYMSPEVINNAKYNSKSDIWALGCILYELMCLKVPFTGNSLQQLYRNISSQQVAFPSNPNYTRDLIQITKNMLEKNPKMRPGINSIVKQPLLKSRLDMYAAQFMIQQEFCHTVLHGRNLMQEARIPTEEARIPSKVLSQVTPSKDIKKDIPPPPAVNPFSPLLQKDKSPYEIYQAEMAKQKAEEKARREKMVLDQQKLEYIQMLKREEMEKEKKRQRLLQEQKELQKLQQIRQQNQQILAQLELKKKAKELGGMYGGPVVVKHQPKEERIPLRVAKVDKVEEKAVAARDYDKPWIQAVKQHYEYDKIKKKIPRSKQKSRENNIAKAEVARLKDDSSDSSKDDKSKDIPKVFPKETPKDIPKDRQEWFENIQKQMNLLKKDVVAMKKAPSDIALNPGIPLKNPREVEVEVSPSVSPRQVNKDKKRSSEKNKPSPLVNPVNKKIDKPSRKSVSPDPDRKEMLLNRKVVREQKRAGFLDFLKQQKLAAKLAGVSPMVDDLEMPSVDAFAQGMSPDYDYEKSSAIDIPPRKKLVKNSSDQNIAHKKEKLSIEEFKALKNKERMEMIAYLKKRPGAAPSLLDGGPSVELLYHGKVGKMKTPQSSKDNLILESIDTDHDKHVSKTFARAKESPIQSLSLADLGDNLDELSAEMRFQQTLFSNQTTLLAGESPMMMFQQTHYADHSNSDVPMIFQNTLCSKQYDSNFDSNSSSPRMSFQQTLQEQYDCIQERSLKLPHDNGHQWKSSPIIRIGDDDDYDDYEDFNEIDNDVYLDYLQQQQDQNNDQQQQQEEDQNKDQNVSDDSDNENDKKVALNPFDELPNDDDAINAILNEDRNAIFKQIESILGDMPDDEVVDDDESFEEEDDVFNEDINYDDDRDAFEDESYRIENSNINDSSFDISKFQKDDGSNDIVEPSIEIIDDDNDHESFNSSTFEEADIDLNSGDDIDYNNNNNSNYYDDPLMKARQLNNDDIKMQKIWQQLSNQIGQDVLMKAVNYVKGNYNNTDDDRFLASLQTIVGPQSIEQYTSAIYELILLMET